LFGSAPEPVFGLWERLEGLSRNCRSGAGIAASASSSAPLSSDVPSTRSRSAPSRFARVASAFTEASDRPLLAAVSAAKEPTFGSLIAALPLPAPTFPFAPPCFVSGCVASYAALRFEISFARCAGVRSRRIILEKEPPGRSPGGSFPQLPARRRFRCTTLGGAAAPSRSGAP
jgi:hypothetical protein